MHVPRKHKIHRTPRGEPKPVTEKIAKAARSPLYVQVRSVILERIENGTWKPGALLPSEIALGNELGVSQGTVRKGLDSLVHDRLLVRRQGSGTFVADHTPADVLFRFFRVYTEAGERVLPSSRDVRVRTAAATKREAGILDLAVGSAVIRIARTRLAGETPIIREMIVVAAAQFPGLGAGGKVPNTLYDLFQHRYGVTVSHAEERIEAVAANKRDARHLGLDAGAPLLKVDRTTFGIGARPIEWRVSLCHLNGLRYIVELR
jgi:GntR family transcriptional regulator